MKLLLDENLSYRIITSLQKTYPGSTQVRLIGLKIAPHCQLKLKKLHTAARNYSSQIREFNGLQMAGLCPWTKPLAR